MVSHALVDYAYQAVINFPVEINVYPTYVQSPSSHWWGTGKTSYDIGYVQGLRPGTVLHVRV